jgi:hypothetical protein
MKNLLEKLKSIPLAVDSHINTHYRIGMRVIKTCLAVMVCLLISLFSGSLTSIPIKSVSAIVTMQTTQGDTIHTAVFRVLGTIIGGVVGILTVVIGLFIPYYDQGLYIVIIPLMLLVNLYLCNLLKMQDSCTISCVVTIIVAARITPDATVNEALLFTFFRLTDTMIGVIVGTVVNITPRSVSELMKKLKAG